MNFSTIKKQVGFTLNKYYFVVVGALVLIILAGGYLLFISGTVANIKKAGSTDLGASQTELASKQLTLTKLEALERKYQQVTSDQLKSVQGFLPRESEIPYLIVEIKNFVESNGLVLESIDSGPLGSSVATTAPTAGTIGPIVPQSMNITVTISGLDSYEALKGFLDKVSNAIPLLELHSLSYSPTVDVYSLNWTTYYQ